MSPDSLPDPTQDEIPTQVPPAHVEDGAQTLEAGLSAGPASHPIETAGRFVPLRPLGRGGLGEVHVALDTELGREVALKDMQARHLDSADSLARFRREAEVTGRLEHPGIVPIYGLGVASDGRPYY